MFGWLKDHVRAHQGNSSRRIDRRWKLFSDIETLFKAFELGDHQGMRREVCEDLFWVLARHRNNIERGLAGVIEDPDSHAVEVLFDFLCESPTDVPEKHLVGVPHPLPWSKTFREWRPHWYATEVAE